MREAVSRERIAVGPSVTSLLVPKKVYMKHPMNAVYSPYWVRGRREDDQHLIMQ